MGMPPVTQSGPSMGPCDVISVPIKDAVKERKCVPQELYEMAKTFFR